MWLSGSTRLTATKAAVLGLNFYTLFAKQSPVTNKIQDRCPRIISWNPYINSRDQYKSQMDALEYSMKTNISIHGNNTNSRHQPTNNN